MKEKEEEKIRVKVEIAGVEYVLLSDSSALYTRKMAAIVDDLMTKNEELFPRLDQSRLAVLSALQLADRNLQLEKELQTLKDNEADPTQSPAYTKLRDDHNKLRDDYAKLRTAYTDLKQRTDKPSGS